MNHLPSDDPDGLDQDIAALRKQLELGLELDLEHGNGEGGVGALVGDEGGKPTDLAAVKAAVTGSVAAESSSELSLLQRFSQLPTSFRLGIVSMAFVAGGAIPLALKPPEAVTAAITEKIGSGSLFLYFGAVFVVFAIGLAAIARLLRPLHRRPANGWSGKLLLGLGILLPLLLAIMPLDGGVHGGASVASTAFALGCTKCLVFGGLLGFPVLLLARAARRHDLDEGAVGALAGVVMGLGGNVALHLHCPNTALTHRLFGHALLALIVTGMAWWLHRRSAPVVHQ